jgi:Ca2+-binding EF-hand superfamily protein
VNKHLLLIAIIACAAEPALAQGAEATEGPKPITKAVYVERVDASFAAVDANKDGFSDRAELEAAETKLMGARKAQLISQREAAFKELDTNKNGSLTLAEFNAPLVAQALPKPDPTSMISRLDANKDGKISAAENRSPAVAEFDRADANKDGTISVEELKARANK